MSRVQPEAGRKIGSLIKRAAAEADLTLLELAGVIGVSRPTIYAYAADKLPVPEIRIRRIAEVTGKTPEFFLDGTRALSDEESYTGHKLRLIEAWLSPPDPARASSMADEVLLTVEAHDEPDLEANVLFRAGTALVQKGDQPAAIGKLLRSKALFEKVGNRQQAAAAAQTIGFAYTSLGQLEEAKEAFRFSEHFSAPESRWKGSVALAALAERRGEFAEASEILGRLAKEAPAGVPQAYVAANQASLLLARGAWLLASEALSVALLQATELNLRDQQVELTLQRAFAGIQLGTWESASLDLLNGIALARAVGDDARLTYGQLLEAQLMARTGELEAARRQAQTALDYAVKHQLRRSESFGLLLLAEIAARRGQWESLEDFARQAFSHAEGYEFKASALAALSWRALVDESVNAEELDAELRTLDMVTTGPSPALLAAVRAGRNKNWTGALAALASEERVGEPQTSLSSGLEAHFLRQTDASGHELSVEPSQMLVWRNGPQGLRSHPVTAGSLPWEELLS